MYRVMQFLLFTGNESICVFNVALLLRTTLEKRGHSSSFQRFVTIQHVFEMWFKGTLISSIGQLAWQTLIS